jgi:hypothetical protein
MRDDNLLPYDGEVLLIEDDCAEFDWLAITRKLTDTIPWQVEIARIFGRAMPVPRLVAWFGDITYSYSGISHPPAPFPAVIERLRRRAETLSGGPFNSVLCNLNLYCGVLQPGRYTVRSPRSGKGQLPSWMAGFSFDMTRWIRPLSTQPPPALLPVSRSARARLAVCGPARQS